jgi:hypothetical protein
MISISSMKLNSLRTKKTLKVYDRQVAMPQLVMSFIGFVIYWVALFLF